MIVKEAIEPSGSLPPNPGTRALVLGGVLRLVGVATGGRFAAGEAPKVAVAAGLTAPLLSVAL